MKQKADSVKQQVATLRSAASALEHGRYSTAIKKLNQAFSGLAHLLDDKLPALPQHDGEPTPADKAQYALRALTQYAKDTASGEMDNALSDFLADAMHLCNLGLLKDSEGDTQDFDNELERGRGHYSEEAREEKPFCSWCGSHDLRQIRHEEDDVTYQCNNCDAQFGLEEEN